jgi:large repetitive protein
VTRLLRILLIFGALAAIFVADAAAYKVDRTVTPPAGVVGSAYSFTFVTSGGVGPHTFSLFTGGLPSGLSLSSDGVLSGTPTQGGSFSFWIEAHDSGSNRSQAPFTMSIDSKLTVTTGSLPAATRGVPYSTTLTVSGGSATSWTVSSGTLPPGFTLSNSGVLAGTAMSEGATTFTVKAANGSKSDTKTLTLSVVAPLGISVGAIPPAIVGQPFATKLAATGGVGTYTFALTGGALPGGLLFDTTSGVISGTPRSAGSYPVQISVTASGGGAVVQVMSLVVRAKLAIATKKLPTARVGHRYATRIVVRGGILPFSLTSSSVFPRGLSLNGETGLLTGKAVRTGRYSITVIVNDSYGGSARRSFTLRVTR